ncbi:MAG: hypothetical protein ACTSVW_00415 [Candidatus Njordarchaeales archaeon]
MDKGELIVRIITFIAGALLVYIGLEELQPIAHIIGGLIVLCLGVYLILLSFSEWR